MKFNSFYEDFLRNSTTNSSVNLDDTDEIMENSDSVIHKKKVKKNHVCQICNKAFRDTYKLKRHEKVHIKTGEIPEPEMTDFTLQEAKLIKETLENDPPINSKIDFDQKNVQLLDGGRFEYCETRKSLGYNINI